ncbi:MAG: site-2 protease family protein [Pseudomonadota bacterium]
MELTLIQKIAVFAIPVIFAITLHEAAHGFIAMKFGDRTAWMLGRVTANPLKHIDPIGTIGVPLVLLLLSKLAGGPAFLFGWAKPVPVNFNNLRRPKRDMLWVAAAGPGANLLMALFWGLMIQLGHVLGGDMGLPLMLMGAAGIFINAMLAALNLLPIPPLDGGRIAVSLLPSGPSNMLARVEPYGIFILLALMFTGVLGTLMWPLIGLVFSLSVLLTGVSGETLLSLINILLG